MAQMGVWSREEYGAERVCGADGSVEQMVVWRRWGCGADASVEQRGVWSRG